MSAATGQLRSGWCAVLLSVLVSAEAQATPPIRFSSDELRRIQAHGPWPLAPARDPGNAASGKAQAIALGQKLFFDARLSAGGQIACATCHVPALAFSDGKPRAGGVATLDRNTPSLWNVVYQRWYGWDGASDSLWSQALRPLRDAREMAGTAEHIAITVASDADLSCRYRQVFGSAPQTGAAAQTTLIGVAKALGAFSASLRSAPTAFDQFRDALARGDRVEQARYPIAAQRGLQLFVGKGQCANCHVGPMFSNGEFGDIGVSFFVRPGVVDPGRHAGIVALRESPYNLLGRFADGDTRADSVKTRHVDLQHRNFGEFKIPSLRNVANTAPYMHDGQFATLQAVLRHYSELNLERLHGDGETLLRPLRLSPGESADLAAFLRTLSDPRAQQWQAVRLQPCKPPAEQLSP